MSLEAATERLSKALVQLEDKVQQKLDSQHAVAALHSQEQQKSAAYEAENARLRDTIAQTMNLLDGLIKRVEMVAK